MKKQAVILLSGGLDSATTLAMGKSDGFSFYALSFNYHQRHSIELEASKRVAEFFQVIDHKVFDIDLGQIGGSALTDSAINVPENIEVAGIGEEIPVTYVPARNTIFLSIALGWAEALGVRDIFIGANAVDYSGYPDCRPEYIKSFETLANLATKAGVEGDGFSIHTPLIHLSKSDIIKKGMELGVNYGLTHSCYNPDANGKPCGKCDSCLLREAGFEEAGFVDPVLQG